MSKMPCHKCNKGVLEDARPTPAPVGEQAVGNKCPYCPSWFETYSEVAEHEKEHLQSGGQERSIVQQLAARAEIEQLLTKRRLDADLIAQLTGALRALPEMYGKDMDAWLNAYRNWVSTEWKEALAAVAAWEAK